MKRISNIAIPMLVGATILVPLVSFAQETRQDDIYAALATGEAQEQLEAAAESHISHPRERTAVREILYPASSDEYQRMRGFGALRVVALSRDGNELPLGQVRVVTRHMSITLPPIRVWRTTERDEHIAETFGSARADAVYLVPLFREMQGAQIVIDFARHRYGVALDALPRQFPLTMGRPVPMPKALAYPPKEVFLPWLERSIPAMKFGGPPRQQRPQSSQ